jgi:predicted Fe-Mo cluster-binding NifX family protein
MKIAITASDNNGFEAKVDSRFGRAPYFAIVDIDNMSIDFIDNPAVGAAGGAGVLAAQVVADQGVEGLISGNYGPKAFSGLTAANIKLYSFVEGTINKAIEELRADKLVELSQPTNDSHAGLRWNR